MSNQTTAVETSDIMIEEVFSHSVAKIWRTLTTGELIGRWLMEPTGFEAEVGKQFTFQTTAAGAWDGLIRCRVLEIIPEKLFSFSWQGGDAANVGYGSLMDTVVTWTLTPEGNGTRLRLVHSGFVLPRNETAYENMTKGWREVVEKVSTVSGEQTSASLQ
ncbi:SRPBCC family protein [Sphingobium sp. B2D3C]|uniref:SRPBCC family protein n=1 Tax=Sphingobium sp. B2D3C TaxID=2940581 RepID=UPI0022254D9B|nr:SRPBCC domain-containing protein [Sphingobium sp. B2D3C]MCW2397894.1 uncharacterized protein YndB with AHSA1/START domain [Sphingobium sp. B2D3C]